MTFTNRYTEAERDQAVALYVDLVNSGLNRRAAGDEVCAQLGPSRASVAAWAQADGALLPPSWQDLQQYREKLAAMENRIAVLTDENTQLRQKLEYQDYSEKAVTPNS